MKKYVLILALLFGLTVTSCGGTEVSYVEKDTKEDIDKLVSPDTPSIFGLDKFSYELSNDKKEDISRSVPTNTPSIFGLDKFLYDYSKNKEEEVIDNTFVYNYCNTEEVYDEESLGFSVLYTEEKDKRIKNFLKENTFVSISQIMTNSDSSENVFNSVTYNIDLSLKNGVSYFEVQSGVGSNKEFEYHANDTVNDLHYIRKDGVWVEASGKTKVLNWNIADFSSILDVYNFLTYSFEIPLKTNGVISGDYEYYNIVTEASEDSISGVDYDKLGNQTVTYIFKNDNDSIYPVSVIIAVDFTVDNVTYKCSSAIQFSNYSNKELNMPILDER